MSMILIEGRYEILHTAPDGDSVKFYPKDKNDWTALCGSGHGVRPNGNGGVQLRLDGIDALETHYTPRVGGVDVTHQPKRLARSASAQVLEFLGFRNTQRKGEVVARATPRHVAGYILTRFADKYGRAVSFAFKGNRRGAKSGQRVHFDEAELRRSLNFHMLREGAAYPTYYSKLFVDIRAAMTAAVAQARKEAKGIWGHDKTQGFHVGNLKQVQAAGVILPKLFRRLVDYLAANAGSATMDGFKEHLAALDDRLFVLSEGRSTGFDNVVTVDGQRVGLTKAAEDLVFLEK